MTRPTDIQPHEGALEAAVAAYLRALGFHTYEKNGVTYWGHRSLGEGRTFWDAFEWCVGCERAGRDLRREAAAA